MEPECETFVEPLAETDTVLVGDRVSEEESVAEGEPEGDLVADIDAVAEGEGAREGTARSDTISEAASVRA